MSDYRRYLEAGATYFFTLVTYQRAPLFKDPLARQLLGEAVRECLTRYPAEVDAMVLLPDHLHAIWTMPSGDEGYSLRWRWIKRRFTREWLAVHPELPVSAGAARDRRRGVWQPRFWEHRIRDERDLEIHANYLHYNPVKHGLVTAVREWPWSTFHRWVRDGHYDIDWGRTENPVGSKLNVGE